MPVGLPSQASNGSHFSDARTPALHCELLVVQVRGAYVSLERARAAKLGYESPIWDNIQLTHDNYNKCLESVLDAVS